MSEIAERGARINALMLTLDEADRLAGADDITSSARAIALTVTAMGRLNVEDEVKSWQRERDREKAFGAELERLAGNTVMTDDARSACLVLLAQWISEGYDGPPKPEDYTDAMQRARLRARTKKAR